MFHGPGDYCSSIYLFWENNSECNYLLFFSIDLNVKYILNSFFFLLLKGLINKSNRKYIAGACLLLAAKLNDLNKKELNKLIDTIVQKFRLDSRRELVAFEFPIIIALKFNLMINFETELKHHYERILSSQNLNKDAIMKKTYNYRIKD